METDGGSEVSDHSLPDLLPMILGKGASTDMEQLVPIIKVIHYAYPPVLLVYFLLATTISVCTLQTLSLKVKDQHVRRCVLLGTTVAVMMSYVCLPGITFEITGWKLIRVIAHRSFCIHLWKFYATWSR